MTKKKRAAMNRQAWTQEEIKMLRMNYCGNITETWKQFFPHRTRASVKAKIYAEGLEIQKYKKFSEKELMSFLLQLEKGKTYLELAVQNSVSETALRILICRLRKILNKRIGVK
jgi:hypothetical protein